MIHENEDVNILTADDILDDDILYTVDTQDNLVPITREEIIEDEEELQDNYANEIEFDEL